MEEECRGDPAYWKEILPGAKFTVYYCDDHGDLQSLHVVGYDDVSSSVGGASSSSSSSSAVSNDGSYGSIVGDDILTCDEVDEEKGGMGERQNAMVLWDDDAIMVLSS